MRTLIVSDIFGCTNQLKKFSEQFSGEVQVVSPYEVTEPDYELQEQSIYDEFINRLGHDGYSNKVQEALIKFSPDFIIAFSAGATAAWRALAMTPLKRVQKMIAFYPGQIRHFTNLNPNCHVDIYFPYVEKHFDLNPVINTLKTIPCLYVIKSRYKHGYMNALSENFNHDAYLHYSHICLNEQQNLQEITDNHLFSCQV